VKKAAQKHKNSAHVSSVVVATRIALRCSVFTSREMAVNATLEGKFQVWLCLCLCLHFSFRTTAASSNNA